MLKVTKFTHSCILVETDDRVALFDPGGWSSYNLADLPMIDRIVYTHEHGDHFNADKLQELLAKYPDAHVVCNQEIKKLIDEAGIVATVREETQCTVKFIAPHEELPIPGVPAPAENGYHFKDVFTHPGDSHHFDETKQVLAMPYMGPWGNFREGVQKVIELKPKYVIPIHDWHFSEEGRQWYDTMLKNIFEPLGITPLSSDSGVTHNLS